MRVYGFTFLVLFCFASVSPLQAQPVASRGVIDLRSYDFSVEDPVELNGEWKFYWQQLIYPDHPPRKLPDLVAFPYLWNEDPQLDSFGYATFTLTLLLPDTDVPLAITLPDMYTSYEIYLDNERVAGNGVVSDTKSSYVPRWDPQTVPIGYPSGEVKFTLLISNFDHAKGGIRLPIILGEQDQLLSQRETELGFSFLLTGSLLMAALFFLALYSFGRHEQAILYFALFCLTYSYRLIGTDLYPLHDLFENLPWLLTLKLEYITLYASAALFGFYVEALYPEQVIKPVPRIFNSIFLIFTLVSAFFPAVYFTRLINPFFAILGIYMIYVSWVFFMAYRNKKVGSAYALAGIFVIFLVFLHDLLRYLGYTDGNIALNFAGYLTFFFLQSLTLSYRFSFRLQKAKEDAEAASVAKTHFLSTMGHELRTPLNAVIGLSELLLDSKSEREKTQFAETIKKSGENLLSIINNILDFTRIESEDIKLELKPTHIPTLLADTIKMLDSLTNTEKVGLSFRFDDALSSYVYIDATRLRQILINLIGNAIKFTDSGEIFIQVTTTSSISEKGQILFIVKDSGIGIPPEKMDVLFERFSQVDTNRNRKYGGTGLGLAITKRLIEGMGGRIWVQSTEGEGTTFYFTIEAKTVSEESVQKLEERREAEPIERLNKDIRILVVEDNKINQQVVLKILERLGYKADIADNGFLALEAVQNKPYDLVFMDMEMPEMDGVEATEKIKRLRDLPADPTIVAMTANATTEDKNRCFKAGMQDFVSKPITLNSTQSVLLKWFTEKV